MEPGLLVGLRSCPRVIGPVFHVLDDGHRRFLPKESDELLPAKGFQLAFGDLRPDNSRDSKEPEERRSTKA
jgi:hypothetical protein